MKPKQRRSRCASVSCLSESGFRWMCRSTKGLADNGFGRPVLLEAFPTRVPWSWALISSDLRTLILVP